MLTLVGQGSSRSAFCDRVTRRNFLKIGTLGLGGLTLPQLLKPTPRRGAGRSVKSVIMIYLVGGPPHQDMFDLKPDGSQGDRRPVAADRDQRHRHRDLRSVSAAGKDDGQAGHRPLAGRQPGRPRRDPGLQRPSSEASRLRRAVGRSSARPSPSCKEPPIAATPPFISLCYTCTHGPYNEPGPGFLGTAQSPFRPMGPTRDDMVFSGITLDRLATAARCCGSFDTVPPRRRCRPA